MHTEHLSRWRHDHVFGEHKPAAERGTRWVLAITLVVMVLEIVAGWGFNSMALLADGWHMSSHALAIGLSVLAYATARRYAHDPRFAFGTWKVEILAGFASAVMLLGVAGLMVWGSVERLLSPETIHYREALVVAVFGLLVNLGCGLILGQAHHHHHDHHAPRGHDHAHGHGHGHGHEGHDHAAHEDLNLKSAYVHVMADAATSVLAILALLGAWRWGWQWLDPAMGLVGAVLVAWWARGLIVQTGKILLDREMDHPVVEEVREVVEAHGHHTHVADLHVWRVGQSVYACALTVVTHDPALSAARVRERLAVHEEIVHATIEIHLCPDRDAPGHGGAPDQGSRASASR
jgi:cation diffusion facilitator family transporter